MCPQPLLQVEGGKSPFKRNWIEQDLAKDNLVTDSHLYQREIPSHCEDKISELGASS